MLLVTTTKGRPAAIEMLKKHISKQTFEDFEWLIIAEDFEGYKFPKNATVIKRDGSKDTLPSICHNWLTALDYFESSKHDRCICAEDDDWYTAEYLRETNKHLDKCELFGWSEDAYYYVLSRKGKRCHNVAHASLACTAFKRSVIPYMRECCMQGSVFIDVLLWRGITATTMMSQAPITLPDGHRIPAPMIPVTQVIREFTGKRVLADNFTGLTGREQPKMDKAGNIAGEHPRHVGMKENWHGGLEGLSERGHNPILGGGADLRGNLLKKWIGEEEATPYLDYSPLKKFRWNPPQPGVMVSLPADLGP